MGGVNVFFRSEDDQGQVTTHIILQASGFFIESVLLKEYAGLIVVTLLVVFQGGR